MDLFGWALACGIGVPILVFVVFYLISIFCYGG